VNKLFLISIAFALSACSAPAPVKYEKPIRVVSKSNTQPRAIIDVPSDQMEDAKKKVSSTLKDPYSAVFDGLYGTSIYPASDKATVVCGTVNAKNAYGGYTGAKKFAFIGGNTYLWSDVASGYAAIDNDFITTLCTPEKT
jgi:hypothetical protein